MMEKFESLLAGEKKALKESIRTRETEFRRRYSMGLRESRIDLIVDRMIEKGHDVNTVLEEVVDVQRQVEEYEKDFYRRNGIRVHFNDQAIDRITEIALDEDCKGFAVCSRLLKDYEHGMKLIRDRMGQREFVITREAVDGPEEYLNRVIREIYSRQSDQKPEGGE